MRDYRDLSQILFRGTVSFLAARDVWEADGEWKLVEDDSAPLGYRPLGSSCLTSL